MAILKTIKEKGVELTYHKLNRITLDTLLGRIMADVLVYADKGARVEEKMNFITAHSFVIEDKEVMDEILEVIYKKLKTLPEYSGTKDC